MTCVPPRPTQPLPQLFLMPVDSQLQRFLIESHRVVEFAPQILDHIEADQREHGLQKKRLRQADRRFLEGQTPDLANLGIELRQEDRAGLELEVGRPRLEPYLVYLFLMLRGRLARIFHREIEQRSGECVRRLEITQPNEYATHRFFDDRL